MDKPKWIGGFKFKSITLHGEPAKTIVQLWDNGGISIEQRILSADDLSAMMTPLRKFKEKILWQNKMAILVSSYVTIVNELHKLAAKYHSEKQNDGTI
jgi:hypothetical protein